MKKKSKAILVLGPESSGTRIWTKVLIESGCMGDHTHQQRWDIEVPETLTKIVWRRSVPHGAKLPDIDSMVEELREKEYEVMAYVTTRDWFCMVESQTGKHTDEKIESFGNLQIAYPFIFKKLEELEIPFVVVSYEALVERKKEYINKMLGVFGLDHFQEDNFLIDGNAKYYEN